MSFGSSGRSSSSSDDEEPFQKGGDQTPAPKQRNNRPADAFQLSDSASLLPNEGDSVSTLGRSQTRRRATFLG